MALLLDDDEATQCPISMERVCGKFTLILTQGKKGKIDHINQWSRAFSTLMAIYCKKFTNQFEFLLKYMEDVKTLANMKGHWLWYDKYFRLHHAQSQHPWEQVG